MPSFDFPEIPMGGGVDGHANERALGGSNKGKFPAPVTVTTQQVSNPAPPPVHSIKIIVPGDPVPKGRPRARIVDSSRYAHAKRFVSFYQPVDTKHYERVVGHEARQAMRGRGLLIGALHLEVMVYLSPPASWSATKKEKAHLGMILPTSRPDADNFLKLAADALNGICWNDDAQIVKMTVEKRYDLSPRLEIEIFAA